MESTTNFLGDSVDYDFNWRFISVFGVAFGVTLLGLMSLCFLAEQCIKLCSKIMACYAKFCRERRHRGPEKQKLLPTQDINSNYSEAINIPGDSFYSYSYSHADQDYVNEEVGFRPIKEDEEEQSELSCSPGSFQ